MLNMQEGILLLALLLASRLAMWYVYLPRLFATNAVPDRFEHTLTIPTERRAGIVERCFRPLIKLTPILFA